MSCCGPRGVGALTGRPERSETPPCSAFLSPHDAGAGTIRASFAYLSAVKIFGGEAIGRRPLLLLGVLLIVVGIQLLTLGLLGEMVAATRQDVRGPRSRELQVERVVE